MESANDWWDDRGGDPQTAVYKHSERADDPSATNLPGGEDGSE